MENFELPPGLVLNLPSPLERLRHPWAEAAGLEVWLKREDQIHPWLSGNKWRKLKYNLAETRKPGPGRLLTFGGAYSNHLYAVAGAGAIFGIETIGMVRGEACVPLNPVLAFAQSRGMSLHYLNRTDYRNKHSPETLAQLQARFGPCHIVPEGGSNTLALPGCHEMLGELAGVRFDWLVCACGTGGTLAGFVSGADNSKKLLGIPVLKNGGFLRNDIGQLLQAAGVAPVCHWELATGYHFGGYAKKTPALLAFMEDFWQNQGIRLDAVYTAKMMYGLLDLAREGFFKRGETVVAVHTGGLHA